MATPGIKPVPKHYTDPARFVKNWVRFSRGLKTETPDKPVFELIRSVHEHYRQWDELMDMVWKDCGVGFTEPEVNERKTVRGKSVLPILGQIEQYIFSRLASVDTVNDEIARLIDLNRLGTRAPVTVHELFISTSHEKLELGLVKMTRRMTRAKGVTGLSLQVRMSWVDLDFDELETPDDREDPENPGTLGWKGAHETVQHVLMNDVAGYLNQIDGTMNGQPYLDGTTGCVNFATWLAICVLDELYGQSTWPCLLGTEFGRHFEA